MSASPENEKIRIGVSSCLLGEPVRWNGDHKRDRYLTEVLASFFEWVPTCPEVDAGMGTPRETVQLHGTPESPRMAGTKTGTDWTDIMRRTARQRSRELAKMNLCGYIFKSKSPSCGLNRIKVYTDTSTVHHNGRGLFADAFVNACSRVPVEEEGRLHDPKIRENFIVRVFAYHRLQSLLSGHWSRGTLVRFHTEHKFLLLAHSRKHYDTLGKLVAGAKQHSPAELKSKYADTFMDALAVKSTIKKNVDVLQHMLGFFKKELSAEEKRDILETIEDYRQGLVPLVVPVTLVRHHVRTHNVEYLQNQVYLNPHPKELMIRNHI